MFIPFALLEHYGRDPDPETLSFRERKTYVKRIVHRSLFFSDLWVWVSWIVLITCLPRPSMITSTSKAGSRVGTSRRVCKFS